MSSLLVNDEETTAQIAPDLFEEFSIRITDSEEESS